MKKITTTLAALLIAAPAFAGNIETFEAPEEPIVDEPMGSSNAAWVVPLVAVLAIVAIAASD